MESAYKDAVEFVNGKEGRDGKTVDLDFYADYDHTVKFSRLVSKCELASLTIVSAVEEMTGSQLQINPQTGAVTPASPLATPPIPGLPTQQASVIPAAPSKGFEISPLMIIALLGVLSVVGFLFFQMWSGNQTQLNYYQALLVSGNSTTNIGVVRAQITALQLAQQNLLNTVGTVAGITAALIFLPKLIFALLSRPGKKKADMTHPPVRMWMQEKFVEMRRRYTSGYLVIQFQNQDKSNVGEVLPSIVPEVLYSRKSLLLTTLRPYFATTLAQLKQVSEAIAEERLEKLAAATVEMTRGMASAKGPGL